MSFFYHFKQQQKLHKNPTIHPGFKGCACYSFASLFYMSKREHFGNKKMFFISL